VDVDTPGGPHPGAQIEDVGELPESFRAAHPQIGRLELAMVGVGGALGALGRVGLEQAWPSATGSWPWTTFAVNILGAFVLGCLMTALRHGPISIPAYRLLGTGVCGALSTFSTMQFELLEMIDRSRYALAIGYVSTSVVVGYAAVSVAAKLIGRVAVAAAAAEAEA
jgi:fluoride exporter